MVSTPQPESFGIYVHIPYCLQRCTYCDFATYVQTEIAPPAVYISSLKKEIAHRHQLFSDRITATKPALDTLYFGGGTPSLIDARHIVDVISELAKFGYTTGPNTEVTLEINPATVDERKLEVYLAAGVNRFSVGAQSFSDRLLKMVHREHTAEQTRQTLALLRKYNLNFSFDLLFALPTQTLEELERDVHIATELGAQHISPYCLTVPEGHPLAKNRPLDEDQIKMFGRIHQSLSQSGFRRYEISNYAKPGFESKHNLLYWTDQSYWGLGLSAHSYGRSQIAEPSSSFSSPWGARFWNVNNFDLYQKQIQSLAAGDELSHLFDWPPSQIEFLKPHESLTDFCYTSLRLAEGLSVEKLVQKFGHRTLDLVKKRAQEALRRGYLAEKSHQLMLTEQAYVLSNQIFESFVFSAEDLAE